MKNHRFWSQSGQEFCEVGHTPLPNFSESYPPPPPTPLPTPGRFSQRKPVAWHSSEQIARNLIPQPLGFRLCLPKIRKKTRLFCRVGRFTRVSDFDRSTFNQNAR